MSHPHQTIDLAETLIAMRKQESTSYKCHDYLEKLGPKLQDSPRGVSSHGVHAHDPSDKHFLNPRWREKICEWYFKMVDHFDFTREIVSISLSFLDRFLCAQQQGEERAPTTEPQQAQLAAMSSLHLAVKLYEPRKIKMSSLADLSRGHFTTEMIERMEQMILLTLDWRVHPPTPLQFMHLFFKLLPLPEEQKQDFFELARFLTELAICDYYFVTEMPSNLAYAAILNALEFRGSHGAAPISARAVQEFLHEMLRVAGLHCDSAIVSAARTRIREIYLHSAACPKQGNVLLDSPQGVADRENKYNYSEQ